MKQEITISIAPKSDTTKESANLSLHFTELPTDAVLDVNVAALLKVSRTVPDLAQDFLGIASCIYAADKAVPRVGAEDKWTRHLAIEIPVEHVDTWSCVANDMSDCIGFLTGDRWEISFRHSEKRLVQKKPRRRRVRMRRVSGQAICLFSGGLDSFIGAVDWLTKNPTEKLLLVGHYDGDVSGPKTDQETLRAICQQKFNGRFDLAQIRVGLSCGGVDTNFRSRSLLFVALGCYFAEILGERVPVLIPENGPIALNIPLTPARRGSCSTRTVHPHFMRGLNQILERVGMFNPVINPYALKTKGEMVNECQDQAILSSAYALTRSCAKSSRRDHWINKKSPSGKAPLGCGICIPCLFRRAALHQHAYDDEIYGIPVELVTDFKGDARSDLLALVAFLRRADSDREIAARLFGNGSLPLANLSAYVDLVKRMRSEVLAWLRASGSTFVKNEIRGC